MVVCEETVSMSVGVTECLFLLWKACWGSGLYNVCYCNYKGVYNFYMSGSAADDTGYFTIIIIGCVCARVSAYMCMGVGM